MKSRLAWNSEIHQPLHPECWGKKGCATMPSCGAVSWMMIDVEGPVGGASSGLVVLGCIWASHGEQASKQASNQDLLGLCFSSGLQVPALSSYSNVPQWWTVTWDVYAQIDSFLPRLTSVMVFITTTDKLEQSQCLQPDISDRLTWGSLPLVDQISFGAFYDYFLSVQKVHKKF